MEQQRIEILRDRRDIAGTWVSVQGLRAAGEQQPAVAPVNGGNAIRRLGILGKNNRLEPRSAGRGEKRGRRGGRQQLSPFTRRGGGGPD
jgi:hypothetical protein